MRARSNRAGFGKRLAGVVCVLAHVVVAKGAQAEPSRSRVAIVRTSGSDRLLREASTRLHAELGDAGFDVVEIERAPGDPRDEVEQAEGTTDAFATVAMNRTGSGAAADIWISDHVTGKTVVRRLRVGAEPNAAAVLAIRALELLRASLLEVAAPAPETTAPRAAPADVMKWVEPTLPSRAPRLAGPYRGTLLGVGALALHGLRGVGPAIGPTLRLSHPVYGPFFARLSLAGPLVGPEITRAEGTASVRQEFASLDFGWASDAAPLGAFAWVGIGAFDLHVTGSAEGPYHSKSEGVLSFLGMVGFGGVARASERVAFTAELIGLGLVPQPVVVIANQDAGRAGAPSLGLSLGVVVVL
jgi:hypothetical protein